MELIQINTFITPSTSSGFEREKLNLWYTAYHDKFKREDDTSQVRKHKRYFRKSDINIANQSS